MNHHLAWALAGLLAMLCIAAAMIALLCTIVRDADTWILQRKAKLQEERLKLTYVLDAITFKAGDAAPALYSKQDSGGRTVGRISSLQSTPLVTGSDVALDGMGGTGSGALPSRTDPQSIGTTGQQRNGTVTVPIAVPVGKRDTAARQGFPSDVDPAAAASVLVACAIDATSASVATPGSIAELGAATCVIAADTPATVPTSFTGMETSRAAAAPTSTVAAAAAPVASTMTPSVSLQNASASSAHPTAPVVPILLSDAANATNHAPVHSLHTLITSAPAAALASVSQLLPNSVRMFFPFGSEVAPCLDAGVILNMDLPRSHVEPHPGAEDSEQCLVCLNEYVKNELLVQLPCGHMYHRHCFADWVDRADTCPICKFDVKVHFGLSPKGKGYLAVGAGDGEVGTATTAAGETSPRGSEAV